MREYAGAANMNKSDSITIGGWLAGVLALISVAGLVACGGGGGTAASVAPVVPGAPGAPPPLCATSGSGISLSYRASRLTGVAPLAVLFDASATTSTGTTRPFHELEYQWNFGDPGSGSWGDKVTGSNGTGHNTSRNVAFGPVAGHVFETPGTYTIQLLVKNGVGSVTDSCAQIVVDDPNTVFSTNTVCVGVAALPVAGANNCPAGATVVQSSDFDATLATQLAAGKRRILFNRGETFLASTNSTISVVGPGIVGAFGVGAAPIVQPAAGVSAIVVSSADWRLMDLNIDGGGVSTTVGVSSDVGAGQITLLRLLANNIGRAINFSDFTALYDQVAVADSSITTIIGGTGANAAYISASQFSFMGNLIDDTILSEHGLRTPYIGVGVISNNRFSRAAGTDGPAGAKTVLTLRAPPFAGTAVFPPGLFTEKVVVADNKFIPHTTQLGTTGNGPQNNTSDERLRDIIWERNWWVPPVGVNSVSSYFAFTVSAITVRNNIVEMTDTLANNDHRVFEAQMTNTSPGYPAPDYVKIYNNTAFSSDAGSSFSMVRIGALNTNVSVQNNLAYAPNSTGPVLLTDLGSPGLVATANSSNVQVKTTNPFAGPPTNPVDYAPLAYALSGGTPVPVWSDFFRVSRPQGASIDMGAIESP
jgi:hypothetical protein